MLKILKFNLAIRFLISAVFGAGLILKPKLIGVFMHIAVHGAFIERLAGALFIVTAYIYLETLREKIPPSLGGRIALVDSLLTACLAWIYCLFSRPAGPLFILATAMTLLGASLAWSFSKAK
jgi:hypothetical protein